MTRAARAATMALLATSLGGCGDQAPPERRAPIVAFDTAAVRVETASDTFRMLVELAVTPDQRAMGLMERDSLPEEGGMLFLYDEPQPAGAAFYMYRTRIPLDIAFLDETGRIIDIQTMQPCESPNPQVCRRYGPGQPFAAALEANRGFFQRRGVGVGDRILQVDREAAAVPPGGGG